MMYTTHFEKDLENNRMSVTRKFKAEKDLVWKAWTDPEILDQWWAPLPWKARTKSMDFRVGGMWLYAMEGPDNMVHWSRADYKRIEPTDLFEGLDAFCDETGAINADLPRMNWLVHFSESGNDTVVSVEISFPSRADLDKFVEMGFEEGFTMAHGNLDLLLLKLK
jgi:uncharacterized protein YndB with AHSA1/START domain